MAEHHEQVALFSWAEWIPALKRMFAIPNAAKRSYELAAWLKAEGLKAGVPDIFLPKARGKYHGLFIEMKYKKNNPTKEQYEFMEDLLAEGYDVQIARSFEAAQRIILKYLALGEPNDLQGSSGGDVLG